MQLTLTIESTEGYGQPMLVCRLSDLTVKQINVACNIIENQLNKIYVPLPVCGGDFDQSPDGCWGWVMFDDCSMSLNKDVVEISYPLIADMNFPDLEYPSQPVAERQFEEQNDIGWYDEEYELENGWLRVLPAVNSILRPIFSVEHSSKFVYGDNDKVQIIKKEANYD